MEENSTADKHPRRLVFDIGGGLIETDDGDRPQLVHFQDWIERPSRLVRFATRLGLAKGGKPVLEAVEKAYEFIARNYAPGDQVILCVDSYDKWETDPHAKAIEILARHLHDGTSPAKLADSHPRDGGNITGSRIPIYGVVVWPSLWDEIQSMCTWSDWLKSRLPPGIQHIDGGMISRELRFSSNDNGYELRKDATKHVLYYKQDWLPEWDEHQPVWTRALNPSSNQAQATLASESMKPAGMHHHEVQRYLGLPGLKGDGSMLVWKSCRKAPKAPN